MFPTSLALLASLMASASALPKWAKSLGAHGFTTQKGVTGVFDTVSCEHMDTCYALNPITPYGMIYLPDHPNASDTSGTYTKNGPCVRHNGLCHRLDSGTQLSPAWRLAEGEAVVLIGRTPPECTYYSWAPSVYSSYHPAGWTPTAVPPTQESVACPDGPSRCEMFYSCNDPINDETIDVGGAASPYNVNISVVFATDSKTEQLVAESLKKELGPDFPINFQRWPGAIMALGVTTGLEDDVLTLLRTAGVKDAAASKEFFDELRAGERFSAYRITPPPSYVVPAGSKFGSFEGKMRPRATGVGEHVGTAASFEDLKAGVKALQAAVVGSHSGGGSSVKAAIQPFQSFVKDSGYECLRHGTQCQGDDRDTIYAKAEFMTQAAICNMTHQRNCTAAQRPTLSDSPDDAFFVVGVNRAFTKQDKYSTLVLYDFPKLGSGILEAPTGERTYTERELETNDLAGTAMRYLKDSTDAAAQRAAPFLYVIKFARNCAAGDADLCYEVVAPGAKTDGNVTIALASPVVFIERNYIHPGTKTGPAVNETVLPVLIHFKKQG